MEKAYKFHEYAFQYGDDLKTIEKIVLKEAGDEDFIADFFGVESAYLFKENNRGQMTNDVTTAISFAKHQLERSEESTDEKLLEKVDEALTFLQTLVTLRAWDWEDFADGEAEDLKTAYDALKNNRKTTKGLTVNEKPFKLPMAFQVENEKTISTDVFFIDKSEVYKEKLVCELPWTSQRERLKAALHLLVSETKKIDSSYEALKAKIGLLRVRVGNRPNEDILNVAKGVGIYLESIISSSSWEQNRLITSELEEWKEKLDFIPIIIESI